MRNLKKFLALVLAMVMAASLMVTANAAVTANVEYGDDYTVDELFEEAVTVLSGMGVIKGYDDGESFGPQRLITRAEAAALIYRLATGDVDDERARLYADYSPNGTFADVRSDAWYAGYVGYCANFGIAKGRSDGLFHPTDNVTGYEILAMILRVVGYDKKGEFSGSDWQYNVSTLSTSLGVLNNVKTYNYSKNQDTLYGAATREVVASLLFETITNVPMVVFSEALSYMNTGMTGGLLAGNTLNPTVGYNSFGLTSNHGIVVGNADTGEDAHVTKIGFDVLRNNSTGEYYIDDTLNFNRVTKAQSAYVYESGWSSNGGNVTLTFKWDSGLDYFGHHVKVWYSDKGSSTENLTNGSTVLRQFSTNLDTYAVFDKTPKENIQIVTTRDTDDTGNPGTLNLRSASSDKDALVKKIDADDAGVYWNYAFGPTQAFDYHYKPDDTYSLVPGDATSWSDESDFTSPIKQYNSDTPYPLYLVISNHPDGKADIVISLEMTITQIAQVNSVYTKTATVGVYNDNDSSVIAGAFWDGNQDNAYFDTYDQASDNSGTNTDVYTQIAQANLTGSSTKQRDDKVVAIAITGTKKNGDNGSNDTDTNAPRGNATIPNGMNSNYYYQLNKMPNVVPATVYTVDYKDGTVTLADNSTMAVSKFANVVDAGFAKAAGVKVAGVDLPNAATTYQFTLDREGNYIYFEPLATNTNFVYATYLDYGTPLSTSTFTYQITYVDTEGNYGQVADVTKYDQHANTSVTLTSSDYRTVKFSDVGGYNANQLPKKDANTLTGGIQPGRYIGYTISGGVLTEVTPEDGNNGGTASQPFIQGSSVDFNNGIGKTTITSNDSLAGAIQVAGSSLFLTEKTIFYIVSGAGTDTQKAEKYVGLSGLLQGNRSVEINGGDVKSSSSIFHGTNDSYYYEYAGISPAGDRDLTYADMIYYSAEPFRYSQNYGWDSIGSARAVDVVYIPAEAVTFNKASVSSLFFLGDSDSTVVNAYGADAVLFEMYRDGEKVEVWIEGKRGDDPAVSGMSNLKTPDSGVAARSSVGTIQHGGDNVFYALEETSNKTNFGNTIYKVVPVADDLSEANDAIIGRYYGYDTNGGQLDIWNTTNYDDQGGIITSSSSATSGGYSVATAARYVPTTNALQAAFIDVRASAVSAVGNLFNVANAKVASANEDWIVKNVVDLSNAGALFDNNGVPVSCVLNADSTRVVDTIYVNK